MSDSYLCCDSCFDRLGKVSSKAAKLWIDLCAIYVKEEGVFDLVIDDENLLRKLELMSYIVTVDKGPFIAVKVLGRVDEEEGGYFCTQRCDDE